MVEKQQRLGRKNGKGFYDYPEKGPKKLWPGLAEMQSTKLDPDTIDVQEIKDRLLAMQALETARCFEEGVLTDVREADVGSILGFGFAPFSGGTLSYIDMMGDEEVRRAVPAAGEEIRAALCAGEAPARHGAEGRKLLWAFRARQEGGVTMQYSKRSVLRQAMIALAAFASLFTSPAPSSAQDYAAIVAAPDRADGDRQTDQRRDPVKLLAFTGVKNGMTVLDMGAGGGYSTELMARAVGPERQGLWPGFRDQRRAPRSASRRA